MSRADESHKLRLSQFEGPLDLLLHLVRRAEIDPRDIFVSEITQQYLEYMDQAGEPDLKWSCEFLEMASLLVLIKSRALLPSCAPEEAPPEEDPAEMLIRSLMEYEMYRKASVLLKAKEHDGERMISRPPQDWGEAMTEREPRADAVVLRNAFRTVLKRQIKQAPPPSAEIRADRWSVSRQRNKIMEALEQAGTPLAFASLFTADAALQEVAVTFYAMLDLWNRNRINVEQKTVFSEMLMSVIHRNRDTA